MSDKIKQISVIEGREKKKIKLLWGFLIPFFHSLLSTKKTFFNALISLKKYLNDVENWIKENI
jgi:hypothetical protein